MLLNEFIALPSRIGIVAASAAQVFGVDADCLRRIIIGDANASAARTTAMALCEEVFAPGSLKDIASHFGTTTDAVLDARTITNARCEFSDEFHETWRLLVATAMGLLAPERKDENCEEPCAA